MTTLVTCRVTIPRPVLDAFTYAVPGELTQLVEPGKRVSVPFGRGREIGLIESVVEQEAGAIMAVSRLRSILAVLDDQPLLTEPLLRLCRWTADYYAAPIGLVHRAALPPGLFTSGKPTSGAPKLQQVVRLIEALPTLLERDEAFGRAQRQREAFEVIEALGGTATLSHLDTGLGFSRSVVKGLVGKGLAEIAEEAVERDSFESADPVERPPADPTPDQDRVLAGLEEQIRSNPDAPGIALLRGVTGSGKTFIYTRLIETVLAAGRSALVLVPEIGLTPQTVARFRAVFGDDVAVLHSGLAAGERHDAWRALREGRKRVVIGTRSAVFAPLQDLGVIVIDEEHDGSYKQGDTPRYHARSLAAMRGRMEGALLLLGSATPSLESWHHAVEGRYQLYELENRATEHTLPEVRVIDRRTRDNELPPPVISEDLRLAIAAGLESNRQALLLLNRRGYATVQACLSCGWLAMCGACNVSLTWHRRRARLVCHHCGSEELARDACPDCSRTDLVFGGVGTEQVETLLGESFPEASIARMDVDTTGGKWAHGKILRRMRDREVDILLGTQMISKGLDLPGVTLVGVIDADVGLSLPDFRAAERTFQLLSQVAGRAGRGAEAGEVLIQTTRPEHPAVRHAITHDYLAFAREEIADRAAPGYPPHRRLANLVVSGENETAVAEAADVLADWLSGVISGADLPVEIVGPAPCPIDRLRGRWRWHMLAKSRDAEPLGKFLRHAAKHSPVKGSTRLEIDRDPESLL